MVVVDCNDDEVARADRRGAAWSLDASSPRNQVVNAVDDLDDVMGRQKEGEGERRIGDSGGRVFVAHFSDVGVVCCVQCTAKRSDPVQRHKKEAMPNRVISAVNLPMLASHKPPYVPHPAFVRSRAHENKGIR